MNNNNNVNSRAIIHHYYYYCFSSFFFFILLTCMLQRAALEQSMVLFNSPSTNRISGKGSWKIPKLKCRTFQIQVMMQRQGRMLKMCSLVSLWLTTTNNISKSLGYLLSVVLASKKLFQLENEKVTSTTCK